VIDVTPETPNLEAMRQVIREHWHDETKCASSFMVADFFTSARVGPLTAIEVEGRDLIRVPCGTCTGDLCAGSEDSCDSPVQDPAGWTPHYTIAG